MVRAAAGLLVRASFSAEQSIYQIVIFLAGRPQWQPARLKEVAARKLAGAE